MSSRRRSLPPSSARTISGCAPSNFTQSAPASRRTRELSIAWLRRVIGRVGQIADDVDIGRAAPHGGDMMRHVGERHLALMGIAQNIHADAVADENNVDAGLDLDARGRRVIGGDDDDLLASALHVEEGVGVRTNRAPARLSSGRHSDQTACAGWECVSAARRPCRRAAGRARGFPGSRRICRRRTAARRGPPAARTLGFSASSRLSWRRLDGATILAEPRLRQAARRLRSCILLKAAYKPPIATFPAGG